MELIKNTSVVFTEDPHSYHRVSDGKELIGVTSMMAKHGLSADYSNVSREILDKASARGKAIHKQLEDYDDCLPVIMDENVKAYKALGLNVVCSEYLVSDNETVASSIDKVLDDCSLADIKTTSSVHTEAVSWQLSIYAYLFERQNPGLKVPALYCIHVRDGKAKKMQMERKPDSEVEELIRCEKEGIEFIQNPFAYTDATGEMIVLGEVLEKMAALELQLAPLKAQFEASKEKMREYMTEHQISELETPYGKFVRTVDYYKNGLDTAAFKKACPELAEKYNKKTLVRGSITFKPNK